MSVQLLHYRAWRGGYSRPIWAIWPIARVALGMLLRRRLFWALYAVALLLFMMFFFGSYLLDWAETQIVSTPVQVGKMTIEPDRFLKAFRGGIRALNGSQDTFAYFFSYQSAMVMVVLTLAGSVLVGNDITFRSIGFYLAKPINRWHYVLGKCLAVGIVVTMLTTLPALLLFAQHALGDWNYLADADYFETSGLGRGPAGVPLMLGIIGFGLLLAAFLSLLLVTTATWVKRTMPLVMIWTTLFFFFSLLAKMLVDGLKYDVRWRLLDLWNSLCLLGYACLGFDHDAVWPSPQPEFWEAALTLGGVSLLCLIYLNRRTRAVEIVR